MFKIGDIVECIKGFTYCNGPIVGERYTVISVKPDGQDQMIGVKVPKCKYNEEVKTGKEAIWGYKCFKLIKKKGPKSEIDILNSFQNNFKEGI